MEIAGSGPKVKDIPQQKTEHDARLITRRRLLVVGLLNALLVRFGVIPLVKDSQNRKGADVKDEPLQTAGAYNEKALLNIAKETPQFVIDPRIGVAHIDGKYPDIGSKFFGFGLDVAESLGFQTVEVEFSPQENKYRIPPESSTTCLADFAKNQVYSQIFSRPGIKDLIITAQPGGAGINAWEIAQSDKLFSPERVTQTYDEFREFADVLLKNYSREGKSITIQTPNELDWHMLGGLPGADLRVGEHASPQAVYKAITYVDTVIRAIHDANQANPSKSPLRVAVEINRVKDAMESGKVRAINAVLPNLAIPPDIIGYSAYDTLWEVNPQVFRRALGYIHSQMPTSSISISELGVPENKVQAGVNLTPEQAAQVVNQRIADALSFGVEKFVLWQLFDNESTKRNPNVAECEGYWMVRPDGSKSTLFQSLNRFRQRQTKTG